MTERVHDIVIVLAAVGSGLVAGIFFAFSAFIMKALGRLPQDLDNLESRADGGGPGGGSLVLLRAPVEELPGK